MSLYKKVASYVFIDKEKEFQSRIACSISTVDGSFTVEVIETKGFKFIQDDTHFFLTREEANAKFIEIKRSKGYPYKREY